MRDPSIGFFGTRPARIDPVAGWLRARGHRAEVLGSDGIETVDVAIFLGPYDESHLELMRRARAASCRILLDVNEELPGYESPWYFPMMRYPVVTGSPAIAARQRALNPNVVVIEDAMDGNLDAIGAQWLSLIRRQPVVDIVIPACGADESLKVCLDGIATVTDVPYRVIVVDSAERSEPLQAGESVEVIRPQRRLRFAEAVNRGITAGTAPCICILKDETMVARGWLEPLLEEVRQRPGIRHSVFPRALYDSVGPFDEGFMEGGEEVDFSLRARRLGFAASIDERSAGGDRDRERLSIKYEKPLVILHIGGALEKWNARNIDEVGIGGSETAAARVASELVQLGHRVVVFGDCPAEEETIDGVEYLHYERFGSFIGSHHADVFVLSRNAALLDAPVRARRRYLWLHDTLPWNCDRVAPNYEKLDAVVCLSPWQRDHVMQHLQLGPEKLRIIRYGIDPARFAANIRRRRHRFIYSSSPDRGLDTLLEIFPRIRAELPDAELHVYYGFDNWEKIVTHIPWSEKNAYIDSLKVRLNQQPAVFYHGRIGQKQLAAEMLRSDVWLYPTRFTETYCMSALEAQTAGVLCICTDLGALTTTVGSRWILLKGDAYSEEYRREAVETTISLLRDRRKRNAITARAREWARRQTWPARGREWAALFGTDAGRDGVLKGDAI